TRAEATAQVFLGVRLQCARCHNHPFDRWTQDDYYGWAANFARVRYRILENRRRDTNDGHEFLGEQVVWEARTGEVTNPRSGRAAAPRFLAPRSLRSTVEPEGSAEEGGRLDALARWIGSKEDTFFARAQANRIWHHLMGRGIVDPIDDFRPTNPPSNPELLDALAADFVAHGFDLKHLVRVIMTSRVYQLSSVPTPSGAEDETHFSHALVRRLSAEEILDAQSQAIGAPVKFSGYPLGIRAGQLSGVEALRRRDRAATDADLFLRVFGKPPRLIACECERSTDTTLSQAFQLLSGPSLQALLRVPGNRLGKLLEAKTSSAEVVRDLYWAALGRPPAPAEEAAIAGSLDASPDRRAALEDAAWGILNSKEFLLRS
ncbi:MAG TPA: DUF1553 domain-containing protein, partial [Planctomycetota bacterium]|nr:DUF1553 domain-containing protein [Planctomycetota bacterium]